MGLKERRRELTFTSSTFRAGFPPAGGVCSFLIALLLRFPLSNVFRPVVASCGAANAVGTFYLGSFCVILLRARIRSRRDVFRRRG